MLRDVRSARAARRAVVRMGLEPADQHPARRRARHRALCRLLDLLRVRSAVVAALRVPGVPRVDRRRIVRPRRARQAEARAMCLVVVRRAAPRPLSAVLAANRDERHARPSWPAAWWSDRPSCFGGRDLVAHGSWLAVDRRGRLAAVTNFRDTAAPAAAARRAARSSTRLPRQRATATRFRGRARGRAPIATGPSASCSSRHRACVRQQPRAGRTARRRACTRSATRPLGEEWPKERTARAGARGACSSEAEPVDALLELLAVRRHGAHGGGALPRRRTSSTVTGLRHALVDRRR